MNLLTDDFRSLTIKDVARIIGKSEQFVRQGLIQNILPFGKAYKLQGSSQYTYYINPHQFYEFIGYKPNEPK